MDVLSEIIAAKRVRLAEARAARGLESLRVEAFGVRAKAGSHVLRRALEEAWRVNVIAEVKRASPSLGVIRADAEPVLIARRYGAGGAAAISVLTEEDRFGGSLDDLRAVREAVSVAVLRKDFIFEEYQLYEAAEAGADAALLIVAALDDKTLSHLRRVTEDELRMDALVEVHTKDEMRRAEACGATLIGINNRDLHTFNVSLDTSVELIKDAPPGALCISESGLRTADDLRRLRALGFRGFLIGEMLMRSLDPEKTLRALLEEAE
jgi:indole-3-glycerol phosphate synthase